MIFDDQKTLRQNPSLHPKKREYISMVNDRRFPLPISFNHADMFNTSHPVTYHILDYEMYGLVNAATWLLHSYAPEAGGDWIPADKNFEMYIHLRIEQLDHDGGNSGWFLTINDSTYSYWYGIYITPPASYNGTFNLWIEKYVDTVQDDTSGDMLALNEKQNYCLRIKVDKSVGANGRFSVDLLNNPSFTGLVGTRYLDLDGDRAMGPIDFFLAAQGSGGISEGYFRHLHILPF